MREPGQGQLFGPAAAAWCGRPLDDLNREASPGQRHGRSQPVRPGSGRDRIGRPGRAHSWSISPSAATLANGTAAGRPRPARHPPFVITALVVLAAPYLVMTNPSAGLAGPGKPVADRPLPNQSAWPGPPPQPAGSGPPRTGGPLPVRCGGGAAYLVMWMTRSMPSVVCSRWSWVSKKQASTQKPGLTWTTCCSAAPWSGR